MGPESATEWFCHRHGRQEGPFSAAAIRQMVGSGEIGPDDLLWNTTLPQWQAARVVCQQLGISIAPIPSAHPAVLSDPSHQTWARTSMIVGILGLLLFGVVLGPLAIVFAAIALSSISRTRDERGRGMATAGLVLGIIDTIGGMLLIAALA